jgi:peptidoglycan/xylan/chitin deacetylase (PgdA/CDA1 family)
MQIPADSTNTHELQQGRFVQPFVKALRAVHRTQTASRCSCPQRLTTLFSSSFSCNASACTAEAIRNSGFDVCCHGWRWIKHFDLTEEEERDHIRRAVGSLVQTVGERPYGWYCRYGPSVNTRRLLVEEGGFLYDSDSYADELPFWQSADGKPHLVVPYSLTHNDG